MSTKSQSKRNPRSDATKARRSLQQAAGRTLKVLDKPENLKRRPDDATIKSLQGTLQSLKQDLAGPDPAKKTLAGSKYFASDFPSPNEIAARAGVPCSTFEQCAQAVGSFLGGHALALPKRFGVSGESLVMEVLCDQTVPCATLSAGSVVYVVVPLNYANRGGIVYARDPASTSFTVLGYLTPANDIESFSSLHSVLGAHLEVSCPTVLGGTSAQVANISAEVGHFIVNPVSLIGGKAAAGAIGRHVSKGILGANSCMAAALTYGCNEMSILKRSAYDKQTSTAVKTITSSYNNPSAYPCPSTTLQFVAGVSASGNYANQGWTSDLNTLVSVTPASSVVAWALASNGDYLKHVLYGDFDLEFQTFLQAASAPAFGGWVTCMLQVSYADGTALNLSAYSPGASSRDLASWRFSSRGETIFASKRGLPITNMTLTITNQLAAVNVSFGGKESLVKLEFHDVSPDTTYLGAVLTGVSSVANIYAKLRVATEVFPDITTTTGSIVNATDDVACDPHIMQQFLSVVEAGNLIPNSRTLVAMAPAPMKATNFGASAMSFIRKIARSPMTRKIGEMAMDAVLGPRTATSFPVVEAACACGYNGVACLCSRPIVLRPNTDPALLKNHVAFTSQPETVEVRTATFFGEGGQSAKRRTGFQFPVVTRLVQGDDVISFQADIDEVAVGDGPHPVEWSQHTYMGTHFSGRSCELAYLLALLHEKGVPVARGLYSAAVSDFSYNLEERYAMLDLLPVDDFEQKEAVAERTGRKLRGIFPDGVLAGRELLSTVPANFFGNHIKCAVLGSNELEDQDGRVATAYELRLTW